MYSIKLLYYDRIEISDKLTLKKQVDQNSVIFVTIGIF